MDKNYPRISIIILNWNGKKDTMECLDSLRSVTYPNYEIILVDNGSTDGSVDYLPEKYPYVKFILNEKNLGFAGGNNVGILKALENGCDYILLLNNDTEVEPDFLTGIVKVAESDKDIGIVGPKICFYNDKSIIWAIGGKINMFTGYSQNNGWLNNEAQYKGIKTVDYVTGCALLIKSEVVMKIGQLDTDYFLYFEDADWNLKARNEGYRSVIDCDEKIYHKYEIKDRQLRDHYYYYMGRNIPLFVQRCGKWYHKVIFYPYYLVKFILVFIYNYVRGNGNKSRYFYRGVKDFILKRYGKL